MAYRNAKIRVSRLGFYFMILFKFPFLIQSISANFGGKNDILFNLVLNKSYRVFYFFLINHRPMNVSNPLMINNSNPILKSPKSNPWFLSIK